ncbi:MAG: hypothetical protein RL368_2452 [Pseudomonadota bacterium]|jgi:YD repeat-containing protein
MLQNKRLPVKTLSLAISLLLTGQAYSLTYEHDALNRLILANTPNTKLGYKYDPSGNIINVTSEKIGEVPPDAATLPPDLTPDQTIDDVYNGNGKTITITLTFGKRGFVSKLIIESIIINWGILIDLVIHKNGKIKGGKLAGYVHNEGELEDFEFHGKELKGGKLKGKIFSTGTLRDVELGENTVISGGKLAGVIRVQPGATVLLKNVFITKGTQIPRENVIRGENVIFEDETDLVPQVYVTTAPSFSSGVLVAGAVIDGVYSGDGKIIDAPITLTEKSSVSNVVIASSIINQGDLSSSTISKQGKVKGGKLSGYMKNEGILEDIEFLGSELVGGVLKGYIKNGATSTIRDVTLENKTVLTGGILAGLIQGATGGFILLNNTRIASNAILRNVIIGHNVTFEDKNVVLDASVSHLLGTTARNAKGEQIASDADFAAQVSVNDKVQQGNITNLSLSEPINIQVGIIAAPEHIGKTVDLFVYASYLPLGLNWSESHSFMLDNSGTVKSWDANNTNLVPFKQGVVLERVNPVDVYKGKLIADGELQVHFGYRLSDGSLITNTNPLAFSIKK